MIAWLDICFQSVQLEFRETVLNDLPETLTHFSPASMRDERVIPQVSRLKQAANDLAYVDHSDQLSRVSTEDEKTVSILLSQSVRILAKSLKGIRRRYESLVQRATTPNRT